MRTFRTLPAPGAVLLGVLLACAPALSAGEDPCLAPPAAAGLPGVRTDERVGAGPVVRFHTDPSRTGGSRVEESEAYRRQIQSLPLGEPWPVLRGRLKELGFTITDSTLGARGRPRLALLREGLLFQIEVTCGPDGKVVAIDAGPNL